MLDVMVLRSALRAFSMMFGSLGMFFLYVSFGHHSLASYAVVFLGTATAIVLSER